MKKYFYFNGRKYNRIYIDTCAVMHQGFENCIKGLIPTLKSSGIKLTVPNAVMAELKRFESELSDRSKRAKRALENISALHCVGLVEIKGRQETTQTPDSYLTEVVLQARSDQEKLLILSQDYQLALDILSINNIKSQIGPAANVKRLTVTGSLEDFDLSRPANLYSPQKNSTYNTTKAVLKRFGL